MSHGEERLVPRLFPKIVVAERFLFFFFWLGVSFLVMKLLLISLALLPAAALAASDSPRDRALDNALHSVDAAFGSAQDALKSSGLPDAQFSAISNVLKTKHDTVKNSINNVR